MTHRIEVEIDSHGQIRPVEPGTILPEGRAILAWPDSEEEAALCLAEPALADWLSPEEDKAWAYLQPAK